MSGGAVYRPALDGLRALAVYLVILFHAGVSSFSGGFIGVDVFFVLSGFLVTQLLAARHCAGGGIRFGRFYARRFRRLLPVAFVTLIVTALVFTAIASPSEVGAVAGSFKAAFLDCANLCLHPPIRRTTSALGSTKNPVLQFWSLAVEEQFYLAWPLALGSVYFVTRRLQPTRQLQLIRTIITIAAIASAAWALALRTTNPNHAYYGTDTRAYELLPACSDRTHPPTHQHHPPLPTNHAHRRRHHPRPPHRHRNLNRAPRRHPTRHRSNHHHRRAPHHHRNRQPRTHQTRALQQRNRLPRPRLLRHLPLALDRHPRRGPSGTFHLDTDTTIAVTCLIATALASLSYQLLEQPIRTSQLLNHHRYTVIATGLTISIISAIILIPHLVDATTATTPTITATTTGFTKNPTQPQLAKRRQKPRPLHQLLPTTRHQLHHHPRHRPPHPPHRRQPRPHAHPHPHHHRQTETTSPSPSP